MLHRVRIWVSTVVSGARVAVGKQGASIDLFVVPGDRTPHENVARHIGKATGRAFGAGDVRFAVRRIGAIERGTAPDIGVSWGRTSP